MKSCGRVRRSIHIFRACVVLILAVGATSQTSCTGCRVDSSPTPSQRLEAALQRADARKKADAITQTPTAANQCPTLNATMIPSTPPANGGHRVTLSWVASAVDPQHPPAAGYCIYRGAPGDLNPGLVNLTPFTGTSCVDDTVANGQRYSYVVRAISVNGKTSVTSNPAAVQIPAQGQSTSPPAAPLCRGLAASPQVGQKPHS